MPDNEQLKIANGLNHSFVLNHEKKIPSLVATVYSEESGIKLDCFTTQKCLHLYTANYVNVSSDIGKKHLEYTNKSALCLETQGFPDAINHPTFPISLLRPGEEYHHITKFVFSTNGNSK